MLVRIRLLHRLLPLVVLVTATAIVPEVAAQAPAKARPTSPNAGRKLVVERVVAAAAS